MEELLKKLAEHFGYAAPFGYAGLAYGLFHWLDENASDDAKAALARTMSFKDYKSEQVALALVEVFDRIYKSPLLRWRGFFRSLLFTTLVSAIYLFELYRNNGFCDAFGCRFESEEWFIALPFNIFTDYLSLFLIRPVLIRSGTKPVIGLAFGALSGAAIVLAANSLRSLTFPCAHQLFLALSGQIPFATGYQACVFDLSLVWNHSLWLNQLVPMDEFVGLRLRYVWPALAVFAWLPLFALGILIVRLMTPLSWIVGRTQWFLKEGKDHPLKAIGYVASVLVFVGTVAGRMVSA